ncbi:alkylhydroperoxidase AhpD family core domain-containing protein [Fodinibius roseus]|uniref:Alkylhydroperoxidase AhpD family core domain-containing protein n=1 Tax=Fodinibius roseus TaxID=1194090 RepID=A0A1M4YWA2_9BACT|nr:carboxymuconolactone decarboxylase family protein [Fodinibius roseus]SHF10099.1 alkylhydroperoxidase AhpD family core domain-containing protein [Fodinibius roseus]
MSLFKKTEPRIYEAMSVAETQLEAFDLDPKLKELIKIRASQMNGCGFCINMHTKDARDLGETEQRLYGLSAWWETPFFTEQEEIALKVTEEVTTISDGGIPDEVYEEAIAVLGEQQFAQVVFTAITINSWNRIAISSHLMPEKD